MPDYTICLNIGCPLGMYCKRRTAVPDPIAQSYYTYSFRKEKGKVVCDAFKPNGINA